MALTFAPLAINCILTCWCSVQRCNINYTPPPSQVRNNYCLLLCIFKAIELCEPHRQQQTTTCTLHGYARNMSKNFAEHIQLEHTPNIPPKHKQRALTKIMCVRKVYRYGIIIILLSVVPLHLKVFAKLRHERNTWRPNSVRLHAMLVVCLSI